MSDLPENYSLLRDIAFKQVEKIQFQFKQIELLTKKLEIAVEALDRLRYFGIENIEQTHVYDVVKEALETIKDLEIENE